ncbi:helix-turn-helix domain-containing protein [Bacillus licheniformis]|uniref:helix-turn-helix domain-containing protein n=1 Tax=Bacillus licheniformis TaxID=1402 RepID=UPI002E1CB826|nr:helix-turn-helix domain-containing protein [Bacillus licheniformis]
MEELRALETFETVSEMDNAISEALKSFNLKTSERDVLLKLSQYSCKFVGVSYLKVKKLADEVGLSERTVKRALKRLSELGIITRIKQMRPVKGGYGASITIINPPSCHLDLSQRFEGETQELASSEETSSKNETIYSKAIKIIKNKERKETELDYTSSEIRLDSSYLENSHIPKEFINAVKPFFGSAKEIYSLWGKAISAGYKYAPDVVDITEIAIQAFKQTVFAHKLRKIKKDFKGYFWGTLSAMFSAEQRRRVAPKVKLWNWLEDY